MSSCTDVEGSVIHLRHLGQAEPSPLGDFLLNRWNRQTRHSAVGVLQDNQFDLHCACARHVRPQNAQDGDISHDCRGDPTPGVAYDDRIAELEPEQEGRVDAPINAGQQDGGHSGSNVQIACRELDREAPVALEELRQVLRFSTSWLFLE